MSGQASLQLVLSKTETLSARQWSTLIGVSKQAFNAEQIRPSHVQDGRPYYSFDALPGRWKLELDAKRQQHCARSFGELLEVRHFYSKRWSPPKQWEQYPKTQRVIAERRKAALRWYFEGLDKGLTKEAAKRLSINAWQELFGERCVERTIRNWVATIEERGGFEFAPMEAYCDGKSVAHKAARLSNILPARLGLTEEEFESLAKEIKARSVKSENMSAVFHSLKIDWLMSREISGLGVRVNGAEFPLTKKQVRAFAASTAARRLGSHGRARFNAECAPFIHTTTATLRPLELVVLDDSRIDLICTDDLTGAPIELKIYVMLDVATRRVVAFTVKEGAIGKEDVSAMLAQFLRGFGLPTKYPMHLLFERGSVACAPAAETLLTSMWPGRVFVHRTSMDGGKSTVGSFWEARSGHWMGKGWIESFMRTLGILLQRLPGQRGGDYRRQPAMLGLKGREHGTGRLLYDRGQSDGFSTQIHEAALSSLADLAIDWINNGVGKDTRERLKASPLRPKRWVIEQIAETVAYYNNDHDHDFAGFDRVEVQQENGALKSRMETPNERWQMLSQRWTAERIHPADVVSLLHWRGKTVTVYSRTGVTFDLAPFRGLRFYKEESIACHLAGQLANQQKKFVAVYDAEALRTWRADCGWTPEIHLICDVSSAQWKPGDQGRYVETLPLCGPADRMDAAQMAAAAEKKARVVRRYEAELISAVGPHLVKRLANLEEDEAQLKGVVVRMNDALRELPQSNFSKSAAIGQESAQFVSRREQQPTALSEYKKLQEKYAAGDYADDEPEAS